MRTNLFIPALVFCFAVAVKAQTADDIIQHNLAARGGLQQIEMVRSIRMSGHASMNGIDAAFIILLQRPEKIRIELLIRNDTIVQAYNGHTGWSRTPRGNQSVITQMTPSEAQSLKDEADFDGPLVHYRQKNNKVVLQGIVKEGSADAYKLVVTNPKGEQTTMLIDSQSYHIIREVTYKRMAGTNPVASYMAKIETIYGDFRKIRKLILPFAIETLVDGHKISMLDIDNIKLNTNFPDSLFEEPGN